MKGALVTVPLLVCVCVGILACAGSTSGGRSATSTTSSVGYHVRDRDDDYDNAHGAATRYDLDDDPILYYGHLAGSTEAAAVKLLVMRYYAAASASDGRTGCALLYRPLAESLVEEYAGSPTAGSTCAEVLSKVFRAQHAAYALRHASLIVTSVRVEGGQGFALLAFKGIQDFHLRLHREDGRWTMHQLLDEGLP
jgi:hypothetical protein